MKKLVVVFSIIFTSLSVWSADTAQLDEAMLGALAGNYQAQRNLAYGYVSWPYPGQKKDPIRGCAWYLVVKHSKHKQYNAGDEGNLKVYCGQLDASSLDASKSLASEYLQAIAKTKKR
jgi:hypothetical protein